MSGQPSDPDGLAKLLAFRYAVPYVNHWEEMTEAQRAHWRDDATMVRGYLRAAGEILPSGQA